VTEGFTLHLRGVPPTVMLGLLDTLDGLHREVQVAALDDEGADLVGQATHDALVGDRDRVEGPRNAILDQAAKARDAGLDRVDITAHYGAAEVAPFLSARVGVQSADAAAQRGELLASPMTPGQRDLWTWVGSEFEAQAAGRPPTSYAPKGH
jgi:hypothetical protein